MARPFAFHPADFRYTHSFVRHFLLPISILLFAAACSRTPDIYQPPIQRKPLTGPEAHLGQFVNMTDPAVDAYIVRDISKTTEAGSLAGASGTSVVTGSASGSSAVGVGRGGGAE